MKSVLVAGAIGLATLALSGCVEDGGGYYERPSYGGYYGRPNPYYSGAYNNAPRYRPHYDDNHNDRPRPDRPWSRSDEPRHHPDRDGQRPPDRRQQPRGDNGGDGFPPRHFDGHGNRVFIPDGGE